jgi:hypothetical protein
VKLKAKTPVKRKAKTPVKRKAKTPSEKKSKTNNKNLNTLYNYKKGYCEATILDENEPNDPCDIHTTENECLNETHDSDYWRSYNCKWKQ